MQRVSQNPLHHLLSLHSALHTLISSKEVSIRASSVAHYYRSRNRWAVSHAEYLFV